MQPAWRAISLSLAGSTNVPLMKPDKPKAVQNQIPDTYCNIGTVTRRGTQESGAKSPKNLHDILGSNTERCQQVHERFRDAIIGSNFCRGAPN